MCAAPSFFLGRQPILDRNQKTVAYELLFRTSNQTGVEVLNDQMATASVISHAFSELGIDAVLGNRTGFINFSAELLLSDIVELLPAGRMVIELLETVEITPEVIERCRVLRQAGFTFALDDMVKITPAHEALLPLIEVVKIDILDTPSAAISGLVMQAHRSGVKVLAEKVETREQARECRELGCDFFQGYFFARPVILEGRRSDPSRQVLLNLLQLTLSNADRGAIERTFKQSPELTYKLMRLVNSVSMGLQTRIESLPRALVVLGSRQLQRWIQVLLFAQHSSGNFPSPLLTLAVTRGKMMELLAERECGDAEYRDQAFMAGILSLIDVLLESSMEDVVNQLNLNDEVRQAFLGREGRLGRLLSIVEALEGHDYDAVVARLAEGKLCELADLPAMQVEAMRWGNNIGDSGAVEDPEQ